MISIVYEYVQPYNYVQIICIRYEYLIQYNFANKKSVIKKNHCCGTWKILIIIIIKDL